MKQLTTTEIKQLYVDVSSFYSAWKLNRKLRRQYQPKTIVRLIVSTLTDGGACRVKIGCGGGKTTIFLLALAWLYVNGKIRRVAIVAPTIVLTRQLEAEFSDMMEFLIGNTKGVRLREKFPITNVSSDSDKKKDATFTAEHDGVSDDDIAEAKECLTGYQHLVHATERRAEELQALLKKPLGAFFVCLPSWEQNFRHQVEKTGVKLDVTIFDEFHNLISQKKEEANTMLLALKQNTKHSHSRWFFSASEKEGPIMKTSDPIFGKKIADVKSSQLVLWGYLVQFLRVTFAHAGSVKGVSEALEAHFKQQGISRPSSFYNEWAVIETVLVEMLKRGEVPQAIMFGSSVPIMKQLLGIQLFHDRLQEHIPNIKVYGIFSGFTFGAPALPKGQKDSTALQRARIFAEIQNAPPEQPFIILNHSVIKEGVDVTRFNCLLLMRAMSEIGLQQALGRVQRTSPGKTTAHTFIFIHEDGNDAIKKIVGDTFEKIHYTLGDVKAIVTGLADEQSGLDEDAPQDFPNYGHVVVPFLASGVQLTEYTRLRNMSAEQQMEELFA